MKMFLLDGNPCKDIIEFVTCYNNEYYRRNYGYSVEKTIDELMFEKDSYSPEDIFLILAWKIGGIDMKQSNNLLLNPDRKIYYYENKGWNEKELKGKSYGKLIEFDNVLNVSAVLSETRKEWNKKGFAVDATAASDLLTNLTRKNARQMGSVYYLTLLYFLTSSRWPIYDQYAYKAMDAIIREKEPYRESVDYKKELPEKVNGKDFSKDLSSVVFENSVYHYKKYVDFLTEFEKELPAERKYTVSRDIDRALWAYGHFF